MSSWRQRLSSDCQECPVTIPTKLHREPHSLVRQGEHPGFEAGRSPDDPAVPNPLAELYSGVPSVVDVQVSAVPGTVPSEEGHCSALDPDHLDIRRIPKLAALERCS